MNSWKIALFLNEKEFIYLPKLNDFTELYLTQVVLFAQS